MGKSKKSREKNQVSDNLGQKVESEHIEYKSPGERITLGDSGTKLFIRTKCNMRKIKVDGGILPDLGHKINKCDFLCENLDEREIHLIEMKHELLDKAYDQLQGTPEAIKIYTEYGGIFDGLGLLDAYIVSPGAQKVPEVTKSRSCTKLCKMLAKYSTTRVDDMFKLLNFVKVVKKNAGDSKVEGRILCSNDKPLEF